MTKQNDFIWKAIQTVCWLIFAGICVQTGALLFNFIYSLFRPEATNNLHLGLNLSELYSQSKIIYYQLFSLIIAISFLKATVFYFVIRLFTKMTLLKPFTTTVSKLITNISYFAFSTGLVSYIANQYSKNLINKGFDIDLAGRYWDDSYAFLMMSAILFVIALIFKKGIELQNENDLTI